MLYIAPAFGIVLFIDGVCALVLPHQLNPVEIMEALTKSQGNITLAAKLLGCCYQAIFRHVNNNPLIKLHLQEAREAHKHRLVDLAISRVERALINEEGEEPVRYVIHTLDRLGKDRGYSVEEVDRQVTIKFERPFDVEQAIDVTPSQPGIHMVALEDK